MKRVYWLIPTLLIAAALSSCGAIPTLPPLDSTVSVPTPQFTFRPGGPTATGQVEPPPASETPAESTSAPPDTHTATAAPTGTPDFTATPSLAPTIEPTGTETAAPSPTPTATAFPYSLQGMKPYYLANFTHPDLACSWMGVAGQIFNAEGVVQKEIVIKAGGELNGSPVVEDMTMPLSDPDVDLAYGPGGFELTLADGPAASDSSLWVQLFSLQGDPLSEKVYLETFDDCQKNLILLNFVGE